MKNFKTAIKRRGEKGVVMFLAISSLAMAIPMVGLTVDVGFLYASKTRLQAAVDGASLAAARALSLETTTGDQAPVAKQNAVNWFYSNFQPGNWSTRFTVMNTGTVTVSTPSPSLSTVTVVATTRVPTLFMKWFRVNDTLISSTGTANRRNVVVMMVLDRSSSMNPSATNGNHDSCADLKAAAKLFTGQFAIGRDKIGMVSFSDGVSPVYPPSTSFRTNLGYNTGSTSGNGAIDQITCLGGTGTAGAISVAQKELDRVALPGALNILLVETDGLPNTLAFNFWDSSRSDPDKSPLKKLYTGANPPAGDTAAEAIGCTDNQATRRPRGWSSGTTWGWGQDTSRVSWSVAGPFYSPSAGNSPWVPSGMVGAIYSTDPSRGSTFLGVASPWHTTQNMGIGSNSSGSTPGTVSNYGYTSTNSITNKSVAGCLFGGTGNADDLSDFNRLPRTDLFGNDVKSSNAYYTGTELRMVDSNLAYTTVGANQKYLEFTCANAVPAPTKATPTPQPAACTNSEITTRWTTFRRAVANATDDAAYRARSGQPGTNAIPITSTIYTILLGGNATGADAPDFHLFQRISNDSQADQFSGTSAYPAYTLPAAFASQPKGRLVFSSTYQSLNKAFLEISSQILRLSQ